MVPAGWPCVGPRLSSQLAFCSGLCRLDWGLAGGCHWLPLGHPAGLQAGYQRLYSAKGPQRQALWCLWVTVGKGDGLVPTRCWAGAWEQPCGLGSVDLPWGQKGA